MAKPVDGTGLSSEVKLTGGGGKMDWMRFKPSPEDAETNERVRISKRVAGGTLWPTCRKTGERVHSPVTRQRAAFVPVSLLRTSAIRGKENHARVVFLATQLRFQFIVNKRAQYVTQQGTAI